MGLRERDEDEGDEEDPKPAWKAKTSRQSPTWSSPPATTGAIAGAIPKIITTRLMSRWATSPSKRSRMTVRLTMTPAPALSPWTTRKRRSQPKVGANAVASEASAYTATPQVSMGRRPMASERGPWKMLITAKASM